jgi:hypothetical protein
MASFALFIEEGKHVDIDLKLVFVKMDVIRRDWIR